MSEGHDVCVCVRACVRACVRVCVYKDFLDTIGSIELKLCEKVRI